MSSALVLSTVSIAIVYTFSAAVSNSDVRPALTAFSFISSSFMSSSWLIVLAFSLTKLAWLEESSSFLDLSSSSWEVSYAFSFRLEELEADKSVFHFS